MAEDKVKTNIVPGQKLRDQMAQFAAKGGAAAKSPQLSAAAKSPVVTPAGDQAIPPLSVGAAAVPERGSKKSKSPDKRNKTPDPANKKQGSAVNNSEGLATADIKERTDAAKKMWQEKDKEVQSGPSAKGGGKKGKQPEAVVSDPVLAAQIAQQGDLVRNLKSQKAPKAEVDAAVKVLLELKSKAASSDATAAPAAASEPAPAPAAAIETKTADKQDKSKGRTKGKNSDAHEVVAQNPAVLKDVMVTQPAGAGGAPSAGAGARGNITVLPIQVPKVGICFLATEEGLLLDLVADGPASAAGMHKGDLVVSVNGTPSRSAEDYFNVIKGITVPATINYEIRRNNATQVLRVAVSEKVEVQREGRRVERKEQPQAQAQAQAHASQAPAKGGKGAKGGAGGAKGSGAAVRLSLTAKSTAAALLVAGHAGFTKDDIEVETDSKQEQLSGSFGQETEINSILRTLAKIQGRVDLLGKSSEEMAMVEEWLSISQKKFGSPAGVESMLPRLDRDLLRVVFLVNNRLTLADLALFAAVYPAVSAFNAAQKKTFVNVCRWFDFLQHHESSGLARLRPVDLAPPSKFYSSIISDAQAERSAGLIASGGKPAAVQAKGPVSSLPSGQYVPYPEGPKAYFGFAFVSAAERKSGEGLFVTHVLDGQPAAKAGLRVADIITSIDGTPVSTHREFFDKVRSVKPEQAVAFALKRGGSVEVVAGAAAAVETERKAAVAAKPVEKEVIVDKQKQSKKLQAKQAGESKSAAAAPVAAAPAATAPAAAPAAAPAGDANEAVTAQANLVRDLKAKKAPKDEVDAAVAKLLELKKLAGQDTGKPNKKGK